MWPSAANRRPAEKVGDATPCRRWSLDRQLYEVLPLLGVETWSALDDPERS